MSTVVLHTVVSDRFVDDLRDDPGPLLDWYSNGGQSLGAQDTADPAPS